MRTSTSFRNFIALAIIGSLSSVCDLSAQAKFTSLGYFLAATDVSNDGSVVVGQSSTPQYSAFRWTAATGAVELSSPPDKIASGVFVSGNGSIMAGTDFSGAARTFRRTEAGGTEYLSLPAGAQWSSTEGISSDGKTIVGDVDFGNSRKVFHWTAETGTVPIEGLGAYSESRAVSADGSVITGATMGGDAQRAFRWTAAGGMVSLGTLGTGASIGFGVNSDGSVIVGGASRPGSSEFEAFRWTESGGMIGLDLNHIFSGSDARAVSDDGLIVIGGYDGGGFLWTPELGMRDFLDVVDNVYGLADELQGWTSLNPYAISPDGRYIVGSGNNGAWILDREAQGLSPVPEPATYGVMGSLMLIGLAGWRHKRRSKRAAAQRK